jgi:N-acetylglutamate synthase-like GNAT family acetyltransferase
VSDEIQVRRARRDDIPAIAALEERATSAKLVVDEPEVMEWLFGKGLLVAVRGDVVLGVVAWQAENLLSVTDVFHVIPEQQQGPAVAQLLAAIEAEARVLMCEANVVLVSAWMPVTVRALLQQAGYQPAEFAELHRIWREVLSDWIHDEPELMVKRLRKRMVMVPV